jgi:Outer membrane protein beta-barrel domain
LRNRILLLVAFCSVIASASAQSIFSDFTYSAGGGLGIGKDDVASYVGNSPNGVLGIGKNLNKLFGMDVEYMYYDLNFRPSVKESQSLSNQTGRMQSISVDGIVKVPRHFGKFNAYGIFGVGFYSRYVSIPSRPLQPGTVYQPAWRWWDINRDIFNNVVTPQTMSSNTKDAGGFNFGGGITHPLNHLHDAKIFLEYRYHRAYQSDGKTIVMPITVGLRW